MKITARSKPIRLFVLYSFFVAIVGVPTSVSGAEVKILSNEPGKAAVVSITGELLIGDDKKFVKATLALDRALVLFRSPGGKVYAGIKIGEAIRLKEFITYVPANTLCTSACALAWLGGTRRLMSKSARVGFHAAYLDKGGIKTESGVANALVGNYLGKLGYPTRAIIYVTTAPPGRMKWLTPRLATRLGIDVKAFDVVGARQKTAQPPPTQQRPKTVYCSGDYNPSTWTNCVGTYTLANGDKYVGNLEGGKPHGQGTYTYGNGAKYVGNFEDGRYHGQGTFTFADGAKYVGNYKDGRYHGQGTYTYGNGAKYVGNFFNGKRHGQGTESYVGTTFVRAGLWENGKFVGNKTVDRPASQPDTGTSATEIKDLTIKLITVVNRSDTEALGFLKTYYNTHIEYYGNKRSRDFVLAEKRAFFERWPHRNYSVQNGTMRTSCESSIPRCDSRGILMWSARRHDRVSRGTASFVIGWYKHRNSWKIAKEKSTVLTQKTTRFDR